MMPTPRSGSIRRLYARLPAAAALLPGLALALAAGFCLPAAADATGASAGTGVIEASAHSGLPSTEPPMALVQTYIANRAGKTGVYSLETGAEALRARAWLVDNATTSIEAQYFIWSTDNIGTLAAEALLRAAERGVQVRVIVDDLLIDAAERTLTALTRHPNVSVRIYNPRHQVGVRWYERVLHLASDFRGFNQRMHDKSFIVDGRIAIIGGRNMAAEYYDYSREFNFRDRDALVLGQAVTDIRSNFEAFWASPLSVPVGRLLERARARGDSAPSATARPPEGRARSPGEMSAQRTEASPMSDGEVARFRAELRAYAADPLNFEPEVRASIASTPGEFDRLMRRIHWGDVRFIHDEPGKNDGGPLQMSRGGRSAEALARLVEAARSEVVIQSPYLVLSDEAFAIFERAIARGVAIRINTNSLAATDNLEAYSGYRAQRRRILALGVQVTEFRPDARVQQALMRPFLGAERRPPKASLHAKTMVVDGRIAFIGTYNLDPRSQNLNTEIGIVVDDAGFAGGVRDAILTDMAPGNSWNPATEDPEAGVTLPKRLKVRGLGMLPLRPIL